MVYTSYEDLSNCIRRNLWKVPQDVDLIVGVPRSGMIPALMLAELMNKRCATLDEFIDGREMSCGGRQRLMQETVATEEQHIGRKKVLVLDDTVFFGNAMRKARERLASLEGKYGIIYGCVYAEGRNAKEMVDLWLEDIWLPGEKMWLYEWNVLHHYGKKTHVSMWDIDGLVCKDPPDDRNTEAYEAYLPDAVPMVIPTTRVGAFVTYRLEKYRNVTEQWLHGHGIDYGLLFMFNAENRDMRNRTESPSQYKARLYREATWAHLFIESERRQAERIHQLTGKPVFCYENGQMYL
jgi:uncharacterized HAD superfamily protein